jgi:WhiB family transcriptional regulator, redox-sensing transcriptional regulator
MDYKWSAQAACRDADTNLFFPGSGGSDLAAKKICMSCAVRAQCLDTALRTPFTFGIWGGTSERQRRRIRRVYIRGEKQRLQALAQLGLKL